MQAGGRHGSVPGDPGIGTWVCNAVSAGRLHDTRCSAYFLPGKVRRRRGGEGRGGEGRGGEGRGGEGRTTDEIVTMSLLCVLLHTIHTYIHTHTHTHTHTRTYRYVHDGLSAMRHGNRSPVCVLYCNGGFTDPSTQGAIVNFNLLRANGDFVGYSEVCVCRGRGSIVPASDSQLI